MLGDKPCEGFFPPPSPVASAPHRATEAQAWGSSTPPILLTIAEGGPSTMSCVKLAPLDARPRARLVGRVCEEVLTGLESLTFP